MRYQQGVGLIEVLVALLLLAIGALGFIALQYRAVESGGEAANRVIATQIARDLAENIRINNSIAAVDQYALMNKTQSVDCYTNFCTPVQKAQFDTAHIQTYASALRMAVAMINCPVTQNGRQCIYVAWDKTTADNNTTTSCTVTSGNSFSYRNDSTCLVMEVL